MNTHLGPFSEYICNLLGFDKFLAMNSGVEACESAIKVARRWGYVVKGVEHNKASVILMNGNFWGRSITASGACDDAARYTNFGPFTPGFPLVNYNDVSAIEAHLQQDPNCVGIMIEPIQGEGGVIVPDQGFLKQVQQLCKKYNVLLITDEIQTGLGRTGKLMGSEWDLGDGVRPDIMTLGKAISGGISPVSGIVANDHIMDHIKPGDHGSTYGGNPFGMAVARAAVSAIVEENMVANSLEVGNYFSDKLRQIKSPIIKEVRSRGLFIGLEFKTGHGIDGNIYARILKDNGILTKATHDMTIRFTPALVITKPEIDTAMEIIEDGVR